MHINTIDFLKKKGLYYLNMSDRNDSVNILMISYKKQ